MSHDYAPYHVSAPSIALQRQVRQEATDFAQRMRGMAGAFKVSRVEVVVYFNGGETVQVIEPNP
jgi:hypothetical protein